MPTSARPSATWLKGCNNSKINAIMDVPEPCALDDPRVKGFPCFEKHQPKLRQNQYAQWMTCQKCGIRTNYKPKKGYEGQTRQMGPHPNLIQLTLEQLQSTMAAADVTEKIANGKLMELKGIQLQNGVSQSMAINLDLNAYRKRMGYPPPERTASPKRSPSPKTPKATPTTGPSNMELLRLGAAQVLQTDDPQTIETFIQGDRKAPSAAAKSSAMPSRKETPEVMQINSSDEESGQFLHVETVKKDPSEKP